MCFEWGEGIEGSGRRPQPCSPDPPWRPMGSRWFLRSLAVLHSLAWRFMSTTWSISSVLGQLLPWAGCTHLRGQHSPGCHSSRSAVYDSTRYLWFNTWEQLAVILLWVPCPGLSASLGSPLILVSPCQWSPTLRAAGPDTSQPVSFLSFWPLVSLPLHESWTQLDAYAVRALAVAKSRTSPIHSSHMVYLTHSWKATGDHWKAIFWNPVSDTGVVRTCLNAVTQTYKLCQYALTRTCLGHLT